MLPSAMLYSCSNPCAVPNAIANCILVYSLRRRASTGSAVTKRRSSAVQTRSTCLPRSSQSSESRSGRSLCVILLCAAIFLCHASALDDTSVAAHTELHNPINLLGSGWFHYGRLRWKSLERILFTAASLCNQLWSKLSSGPRSRGIFQWIWLHHSFGWTAGLCGDWLFIDIDTPELNEFQFCTSGTKCNHICRFDCLI